MVTPSKGIRKPRVTRADYEAQPKTCNHCGQIIPYEKRKNQYCSSSCAAQINNLGVRRHPPTPNRHCQCGKPITKPLNKWCDDCIADHAYNRKLDKVGLESLTNDRSRKQWLMLRKPHQCEICGVSEWQGELIPLELDHVDGNADNNAEENLRLICPICHARTPTYKGANRGNSSRQIRRRKRYADGQTW